VSNLAWLVVLAAPIFVVSAVSRNHRRRVAARSATVTVGADADGVGRTLADGRHEHVAWSEITSVDVFHARMGPHQDSGGAVVLYGDATRGCVVPLDQLGSSGLLDQIWRLPGFEIQRLLRAVNVDPRDTGGSFLGRGLSKGPPQRSIELWVRPEAPSDAPPD
jgi:hypothetical protein